MPPTLPPDPESARVAPVRLRDLSLLFARLGATSFGGPAAHIALMREEVVARRGWLAEAEFLDLLGAANLIPGPSSTELAIYIGRRLAGWPGLFAAGLSFLMPAVFLVAALAWAYLRYGALPQAAGLLYGVKPVVVAVVLHALYGLGRSALKTPALAVAAAATLLLSLYSVSPLALLAACGALFGLWRLMSRLRSAPRVSVCLPPLLAAGFGRQGAPGVPTAAGAAAAASAATAAAAAAKVPLLPLFLAFLKAGAVLFGSGYVLLAFLRADLVQRYHWLTESQLLDAIAVGQLTPGPVFTTATFIGYLLAGPCGAAVATVGIFLPAFVFVALSGLLLPRLRRSPVAAAFLDAVNAASLGLMAAVTVQLGQAALVGLFPLLLLLAAALCLFRFRINPSWLVLAGGTVGLLAAFVHP